MTKCSRQKLPAHRAVPTWHFRRWKRETGQHICQNIPQRLQIVTCHWDMQGSDVLFTWLYNLAKSCLNKTLPDPQSIYCIIMSKEPSYSSWIAQAAQKHLAAVFCVSVYTGCTSAAQSEMFMFPDVYMASKKIHPWSQLFASWLICEIFLG